jgi:hypothetical protein
VANVLGGIAAEMIDVAARGNGGDEGGGDRAAAAPRRTETQCQQRLREWQAFHQEPGLRPPPQIRCGTEGEWPDEHPATPPAPPPPPPSDRWTSPV